MVFRPFQDSNLSLNNLQDELNRLMSRAWHAGISTGPLDGQQWAPLVDMDEYPDRYVLHAEVPGMDGKEIELTQVGHVLTLRGEKRPSTGGEEQHRTTRSERRFGTFSRSVDLPEDADGTKVSARCHNGVLEITVPKNESARPRSVKIKVENPESHRPAD